MIRDKTEERLAELDNVISKSVDLKNRRIYFGSSDEDDDNSFNWLTVEMAIRGIHQLVDASDKDPIELHISSPGGNCYDALRLIDAIHLAPVKIIFVGGGEIMSSAAFVMAACDERLLYPNACIMLHEISEQYSNEKVTWTEHKINDIEWTRLQELLYQILEDNSRMPKEFWRDILCRDLYLTSDEAVMLGIADKVLQPKKRGNLRKVRNAALAACPERKQINDLVKDIYKRVHKEKVASKIEIIVPGLPLEDESDVEN